MISDGLHDYFVASASVAGALIGLLFVAITVASDRLSRVEDGGQIHRIRASAALTAFTNTLVVSLMALVPEHAIGPAAAAAAGAGILFVIASLLSLIRLHQIHWRTIRDALFMVGLIVTFAAELIRGADVISHPDDSGAVNNIAVLVMVCFLIGIDRAWELVGGPSIGLTREVAAMVRGQDQETDGPAQPGTAED